MPGLSELVSNEHAAIGDVSIPRITLEYWRRGRHCRKPICLKGPAPKCHFLGYQSRATQREAVSIDRGCLLWRNKMVVGRLHLLNHLFVIPEAKSQQEIPARLGGFHKAGVSERRDDWRRRSHSYSTDSHIVDRQVGYGQPQGAGYGCGSSQPECHLGAWRASR